MSKLDKTPPPVREAIALALMVAALSATAASLLHESGFILAGTILFLVFYIWKLHPKIRAAYQQQEEEVQAEYADDASYEPILDRFRESKDDKTLLAEYHSWKMGPHSPMVRLRFLQSAIIESIDAQTIYHTEELLSEMETIAINEGLKDRFEVFRAECDKRIALIAQERLSK